MIHALKTKNPFFQDVCKGLKNFEVRKNDRDFKIGDTIVLKEFPTTGRAFSAKIKYILEGGQYGISKNYLIIGF